MLRTLINYAMVFTVFCGGFVLLYLPAEFMLAYAIILAFAGLYLILAADIHLPKGMAVGVVVLLALSVMHVWQGTTSWGGVSKQFAGIVISALAYYWLFRIHDGQVEPLFRIYLRLAVCMAGIAIFQEISFIVGFPWGYYFGWFMPKFSMAMQADLGLMRVTSLMPEPAMFATILAPAVFIALCALFKDKKTYLKRWQSGMVLLAMALTFSLVGYAGIGIGVSLLVLNSIKKRTILIGLLLLPVCCWVLLLIPDIRARVYDTMALISGKKTFEASNLSSGTLTLNLKVAYIGFSQHPLLGNGFGGYERLNEKFSDQVVGQNSMFMASINRLDANSLFLRVLAEFGLIGIAAIIAALALGYVSRQRHGHYWIISNATLCFLLLKLLRDGHYFNNGLFFFVWLYYFSWRAARHAPVEESIAA